MAGLTELKNQARAELDRANDRLVGISHEIHSNPEIAMEEVKAAELLTKTLAAEGFKVTRGVAGMPTAFIAEYGNGDGRTVGILAEYDALPGIGHACGHNISAASCTGAGIAVKRLLEAGRLSGTIKVFGTPAEEGGGGKALIANAGLFDGLTAAVAMHSGQRDTVGGSCLATRAFTFRFHGKPAHSAAAPDKGVNALDAVILTFSAVNALRQHVRPDVRLHGIITDGGQAVNIVPEFAECRIQVRAAKKAYLAEVIEKVLNIARGAALQTGATLDYEGDLPYDDILECPPLAGLLKANMEQIGLTVEDHAGQVTPASSDVGNASYVVPTCEANFAMCGLDVAHHTVGFREASASPAGDAAILSAAKAMAMTAIDLLVSDEAAAAVAQAFAAAKRA